MLNFKNFLLEEADEEKLKHLPHVEDHILTHGHAGFTHAHETLSQVHNHLTGKSTTAKVSTKYDGSPSVIFGHHPETGKFFVASKSVFNKEPKLNYSAEDIKRNHGHAPGLVGKLTSALKHLPKVTPKHGVYQGDVMHTPEDVKHEEGHVHFKPNTITYSAHESSPEGKKAAKSKIGVAVHTAYHGDNLEHMKAEYNADVSHFAHHPDVHNIDTRHDVAKTHYPEADQKEFHKHMAAAAAAHKKIPDYSHLSGHSEHLQRYVNKTVRTGETPSVEGYKKHLQEHGEKEASKVKTEKSKQLKLDNAKALSHHVNKNKESFEHTFKAHEHLQHAKNILVNALNTHAGEFKHTIDNKPTNPEGYVASVHNRPSKLVHRHEFSRSNFAKDRT